ncbi:MAG TPA: HRDC domain-containing protein [Egibacteraceae bacterium]|nr:HRDC domain-containing protein [Egibacteraceae bacterium]
MALERYEVADTPDRLSHALAELSQLEQVGVDVERADWDRYWRRAALIQVGGEGIVVLVDPMVLESLEELDAFLAGRLTVLHAMENDLPPLASAGVQPDRIADTAIAAGLLGLPTGLESLLAELLDVRLEGDKAAMQRADWERRPLTEDMLRYAAGDVADLPALWRELEDRLHEAGRMDWYRQELDAAIALPAVHDRRDWTRTKGAGRLDGPARARLRVLWDTREELARDHDTAPGRIMPDKLMIDLAGSPAGSPPELVRRGMRRQAARDHGERIVAALRAGHEAAAEPAARTHRPITDADRALVDKLRVRRAELARGVGIDPGILCPSRTLMNAVVADPPDPATLRELLGLRPWQWEILGWDFCEILELDGPGMPERPAVDPAGTADDAEPPPTTDDGSDTNG